MKQSCLIRLARTILNNYKNIFLLIKCSSNSCKTQLCDFLLYKLITQAHTKKVLFTKNLTCILLWILTRRLRIQSLLDSITSAQRAFGSKIMEKVIWEEMVINPIVSRFTEFGCGVRLTPSIQGQGYFKVNHVYFARN